MKPIITVSQQNALLKAQALKRLNRKQLSEQLGISRFTTRAILYTEPPFAVNSKTFTAVNNWLINELDK